MITFFQQHDIMADIMADILPYGLSYSRSRRNSAGNHASFTVIHIPIEFCSDRSPLVFPGVGHMIDY